MRPQPQIGLSAAAAAASGGGSELLTNTTFASGASWTAGHIGDPGDPTITGGKAVFNANFIGNDQFFVQTLAGGSVVAGNYTVGFDVDVNEGGTISIILLGAADQVRGSADFGSAGAGQTASVTATGEVSKFRIQTSTDATVDNPTLKAA